MKVIRSILFIAIGIVSIILGSDSYNSETYYNGECYDANGYSIGTKIHIDSYDRGRSLLFILGGATLIVFAIPTNIKYKKGNEQ